MKITVAVAQYIIPSDVDKSLDKLESMALYAKMHKADLIVAPECAIGYWAKLSQNNKDFLPSLQSIAKRLKIAISTSFYRLEGGEFFNCGYIVSNEGTIIHSHKKIYTATPEEVENISAGSILETKDSYLGKLGMLICKDAFVNESNYLFEKLAKQNVEILCIPMWSLKWEIFTEEQRKAYITYAAFRTRSFVLMSSNLNSETGSFGRSLIVSPIYGVLQEASVNNEEILVQEIDLDEIVQARKFDLWWQPKSRLV